MTTKPIILAACLLVAGCHRPVVYELRSEYTNVGPPGTMIPITNGNTITLFISTNLAVTNR